MRKLSVLFALAVVLNVSQSAAQVSPYSVFAASAGETPKMVVSHLQDSGHVTGWLGTNVADSLGLEAGARVVSLQPDSSAAKSGIKSGDIVTAVNGKEIKTANDLLQKISELAPGTSVSLSILRDGARHTMSVTLGTRPAITASEPAAPTTSATSPAFATSVAEVFANQVTAAGGCRHVYSFMNASSVDDSLFGKPLADWSDDDIAAVIRVFKDCYAKAHAMDVADCERMGERDCEKRISVVESVNNHAAQYERKFESAVRYRVTSARDLDNQRKVEQVAKIELEKAQAQSKLERVEKEARAKQEQLREQARREREAAEEARRSAEREEPKIAEATREAEEAQRARQEAERRLAEIRSRIEAQEKARKEALAKSQAEEDARQQALKRQAQIEVEKAEAQRKRDQAEKDAERKQEQLREQARRDREAAEEALRLAEHEEPKIAEATKEAEEARHARQAAEQRLAEIRSRIEAQETVRKEALAKTQAAEDARQQALKPQADQETTHVYASKMAVAMPTVMRGIEAMTTACGAMSALSDVDGCARGLDIAVASVHAVQSDMSSLAVPDCLRNVDAKLRLALDLLGQSYTTTRNGLSAHNVTILSTGIQDMKIGNQVLEEAARLVKAASATGACAQ